MRAAQLRMLRQTSRMLAEALRITPQQTAAEAPEKQSPRTTTVCKCGPAAPRRSACSRNKRAAAQIRQRTG